MKQEIKMLSEELEGALTSSKEPSPLKEMTVSVIRSSPSPKQPAENAVASTGNTDCALDRLNLESYIEKMVPDSPHTSDMTEGEPNPSPSLPNPLGDDLEFDSFKSVQEQNPNESIRSWLQRITQMQNEIQKKLTLEHTARFTSEPPTKISTPTTNSNNSPQPPSKIVKYQDLPYMGEMTLDNSKPRRGRKPKKADICHLIYKNYGTIFPGTPDSKILMQQREATPKKKQQPLASVLPSQTSYNKSDVQNKIISSLLERRLTQEIKKSKDFSSRRKAQGMASASKQNEPLNLCIRDLNQLKIRLMKTTDTSETNSEIKSEPPSDDEVEFVNETPSPVSEDPSDGKFDGLLPDFNPGLIPPELCKNPENGVAPGGYVYWPNAGVFIHPMALQQHLLYYQRLAANSTYTLPSDSPKLPPESSPGLIKTSPDLRKIAPKVRAKKQELADGETHNFCADIKPKRNATCTDKTPAKRKRSAIFIPPIPPENQTNPATEVSICKFKFTGGAKPSLQEKKMLSVDSGGNFRYYSGTGDKSMRGYEFFPRETLQQQVGNAHGSSTGAFLQASGEKIYPSPTELTGKHNHSEFMLTPDIPAVNLPPVPDISARHKKRKSRKSLQREKLEQTFKEKGFLIQTQQLESAEGATYCKFRQLRKFTRYLFRSWKDYLPGNIKELQEGEDEVSAAAAAEKAIEDFAGLPISRLSPEELQAPL